MKSGGAELEPRTLSPTVNTWPGMVSRMDAVASSNVRSQRAMSPAPTSTCADVPEVAATMPRAGGAPGPTDRSPVQVHSSPIATRTARAGMTRKRVTLRRLGDIEASVAGVRRQHTLLEQKPCAGVGDLTSRGTVGCGAVCTGLPGYLLRRVHSFAGRLLRSSSREAGPWFRDRRHRLQRGEGVV